MPICQCIFSQADIRNPHSLRSSTPNNCHPVKQISRQPASFYVKTATGVSSAAVLLYSSSRHGSCISLILKNKAGRDSGCGFPTCFIIRLFFISVNSQADIRNPHSLRSSTPNNCFAVDSIKFRSRRPTPSHNSSAHKSFHQHPLLPLSQPAPAFPDNIWWKKPLLRHLHRSPQL